jgi:hypothetical protein
MSQLIILWNMVFLERLLVAELAKKFVALAELRES